MDVGIGLPSTIRGVEREQLLDCARRAEARGFSTLGTIDRIVYDAHEPLIALTATAAVTERACPTAPSDAEKSRPIATIVGARTTSRDCDAMVPRTSGAS